MRTRATSKIVKDHFKVFVVPEPKLKTEKAGGLAFEIGPYRRIAFN